jgi:hypothetical protein
LCPADRCVQPLKDTAARVDRARIGVPARTRAMAILIAASL